MKIQAKTLIILPVIVLLAACSPSGTSTRPDSGSAPDGWLTYTETTYGFSFSYPPEAQITARQGGYARIEGLPIVAGTTLVAKYLEVNASLDALPCPSPELNMQGSSGATEEVTVGDLTFLKQTGGGVATGNIYEGAAYSTQKGGACASLTFVLHYTDQGSYVDPPPVFDREAEEQVFTTILGTFRWTSDAP